MACFVRPCIGLSILNRLTVKKVTDHIITPLRSRFARSISTLSHLHEQVNTCDALFSSTIWVFCYELVTMFDSIGAPSRNKTFIPTDKKIHFGSIFSKTVSNPHFHRRPAVDDPCLDFCAARPSYSAAPITVYATTLRGTSFSFSPIFDISFVIDNSGIMSARSWRETKEALKVITSISTQHHVSGIEIYFLNGDCRKHITTPADVENGFASVHPRSGTSVGSKLNSIMESYLLNLEQQGKNAVKPLDIIVISDGKAGDDLKNVVLSAARKLDRLDALAWQVGIQFCQVGNDPKVRKWYEELEATLAYQNERDKEVRNIVDTIPWMKTLDGQDILTSALGAVDRRYNNKDI